MTFSTGLALKEQFREIYLWANSRKHAQDQAMDIRQLFNLALSLSRNEPKILPQTAFHPDLLRVTDNHYHLVGDQ